MKKTIGRNPANDYQLTDLSVSSQHAMLLLTDCNEVRIKDLNSVNGTFVNGKRITTETTLKLGDRVMLGQATLNWTEVIQAAPKAPQSYSAPSKAPISLPPGTVQKKLIGRSQQAHIRLTSSEVSDSHAYLCCDAKQNIYIVDNHSTNGTFVNGLKVTTQLLKSGDKLTISQRIPLDWEAQFTPPKRVKWGHLYAAAAIVAALLVGATLFLTEKKLEPTAIYSMYKRSVVLIYQNHTYHITCDGQKLSSFLPQIEEAEKLDCFFIDSNQEATPGIGGGTGTGFFVSSDGKIVTNRHVTTPEKEKEAEMITKSVQRFLMEWATHSNDKKLVQQLYYLANNLEVEYQLLYLGVGRNDSHVRTMSDLIDCSLLKESNDPNIDIALIQLNSKITPSDVKHLVNLEKPAEAENLTLGKPIYTLGFPLSFTIGTTDVGLEANNQSGEITQERGEYIYGHNISIHQGASGSPVFDAYGKFAGVIVSGFLGVSQGYNHAIKPHQVIKIVHP